MPHSPSWWRAAFEARTLERTEFSEWTANGEVATMRRYGAGLILLVLGLSGTVGVGAIEKRRAVAAMAEAADSFLGSLSATQRAEATFAFDSDERERHHFIPPETFERNGTLYKDMNFEQKVLALDLLRSGLSLRGYEMAQKIMEVEGILGVLVEGEGRNFARDQEEYFVSVFGTPSTTGTWGWRWEGHHLSLHYTVVEGEATVSTPTFLGANPAYVPTGPRKGLRAMAEQEDTARELLASLDGDQRRVVIFDDVAPGNILTGADAIVEPFDPIGIRGADLSSSQRDGLMAIIESYIAVMAYEIAELRRAEIRADGLDDVTFAWAGGTERGEVAYYRVQGPSFLIEYDNTQEDPNHIHAAFRDFDGDLGRDVLREHLEQDH